MPDCPAFGQSATEQTKMLTLEPVQYQNKGTQSSTGMLPYRTERPDAGGIGLDAYAQLWVFRTLVPTQISEVVF